MRRKNSSCCQCDILMAVKKLKSSSKVSVATIQLPARIRICNMRVYTPMLGFGLGVKYQVRLSDSRLRTM